MPIIDVTLAEGLPPEALRQLMDELTAATQRALDAPLQSIRVILREVPRTHFAAGNVTLAERAVAQRPADSDVPSMSGGT